MELYNVPRQTHVRIVVEDKVPPCAKQVVTGEEQVVTGEVVFFDHIDGMYSFCRDKDGEIVHLAAWTEVEVVDGFEGV
jgi:hypothetical protein